jgi:hypothetical protein
MAYLEHAVASLLQYSSAAAADPPARPLPASTAPAAAATAPAAAEAPATAATPPAPTELTLATRLFDSPTGWLGVCVCVCERERERERESIYTSICMFVCMYIYIYIYIYTYTYTYKYIHTYIHTYIHILWQVEEVGISSVSATRPWSARGKHPPQTHLWKLL